MIMENTENSLYALLIGISKDVGEIKSDVKNVQKTVEDVRTDSTEHDKELSTRLEEYFDYAKKRQDSIKAELETKIGNVRSEVKDIDDKVTKLEEKPKNKLWEVYDKFKGLLLAAILAALVGWCMKFMTDFAKSVRPPVPQETEQARGK